MRQNYHQDCEAAINRQINLELYASYVYLSMVSGGGGAAVAGERAAGGPASRRPRPCGGRLRAVPPGAAALRSSPRGRGRPEPLAGCGGEVGALISGRASAAR